MSNAHKPVWAVEGRTGPVRRYMQLVIFAYEGLIAIHDERPDQKDPYQVVTPTEFEERLSHICKNYRGGGRMDLPEWKRKEFDEQQRGYQNCVDCIKEARAMGDPSDPEVQQFWARHRRSSTVKVSYAPQVDREGYGTLPPIPQGRITGNFAEAGTPIENIESVPTVYVPPTRRHIQGSSLLAIH